MTSISQKDIEHWRTWIGREESRSEFLDACALRRYAAAIGEDLDVENRFPSLGHWAFFLSVAANADIGEDGHSKKGGFMPPVELPRRMFAAAEISFDRPLLLGAVATMTMTITDIRHRTGKSGNLVFVDVERKIRQCEQDRLVERQSIVYREAGAPAPPVKDESGAADEATSLWRPGSVELFRFSAVTFNSHRIHYDLPYATEQEGYPGLVVQGPLVAAKLFGFARARLKRPLMRFGFRGVAPMFSDQAITLAQSDTFDRGCEVRALRCDGALAMTASAET